MIFARIYPHGVRNKKKTSVAKVISTFGGNNIFYGVLGL